MVSASMARCSCEARLAVVTWTRPSAASAAAETVAALATHIADDDHAAASSAGDSFAARRITVAVLPRCPMRLRKSNAGRGCGGMMPWTRPSAIIRRILAIPWRAAPRGDDGDPPESIEARLPGASPPK